jgi:hypothetical protein
MNFFKELITDGSGLSSKRFISLTGMIIFLGVVIVSVMGKTVPDIIIITLAGIILGNGALTLGNKKGGTIPPQNDV